MRLLSVIVIVFGFAKSAAADAINFTCTTDPLTTSFSIFSTDSGVTARVIHHNGTAHMPIAKSVDLITPADLPRLQKVAVILAELGDQYDIQFKESDCTLGADHLIDCAGVANQVINGHKITDVEFYTSNTTYFTTLTPTPYPQTWMNVDMTIDGKDYKFNVAYNAKGCFDPTTARRLQ